MKIFRKLDEIPAGFGPTILSVGNFDGVHRAHRHVIRVIAERSHQNGYTSMAVTFDPHPTRILRPDVAPRLITPTDAKLKLLEAAGLDAVLLLPFTRDLSLMRPVDFARDVLAGKLHAKEIHEGFNFHFGHKAEGNVERLTEMGREFGFEVVTYPAMKLRGHVVSSSEIRQLISAGKVGRARALLGRPFSILGKPGRGRGYGHKYTVPTINLARYDELVPANGVYITRIKVGDECFDSVTNVGVRPTFGPDSFAIETHILDFHPIELLADTPIELIFYKRLRDEVKFPSVDALREQIGKDVQRTRRFFNHASHLAPAPK
jgi:riboflavin kinase/FMN adenylyltransferase